MSGFAMKHWIAMLVCLAVGYYVGMKHPNLMSGMKAKATGS